MSDAWVIVVAVGVFTIAFKAAGPLVLGRRALGPRVSGAVALLAPVMLTALVVTQTVGGDRSVVVDERLAGVAVAGVGLWRGVPLVAAMAIAAAVTALLRLAA